MSVPANFFDTYTVVASPADDTETVIATLAGITELLPALPVHLSGWVNVTKAVLATDAQLTIRAGSLTGDTVAGPFSVAGMIDAAADDCEANIQCVTQPGDFTAATYVLTLTMTTAGDASTVNAVHFGARVG